MSDNDLTGDAVSSLKYSLRFSLNSAIKANASPHSNGFMITSMCGISKLSTIVAPFSLRNAKFHSHYVSTNKNRFPGNLDLFNSDKDYHLNV